MWPDGPAQPTTSSLNMNNSGAVANFDIVPIGADGKIDFATTSATVNLLADITGYVMPGTSYTGLTPVRWFDTRAGAGGVPIGPVRTGKPLSLKVAGVDGVPADATAVALNVTAVGASTPGYLTVWPDGPAQPTTSSLNMNNSGAVANFDIVPIGADGKIDFATTSATVNLLADITGYVMPGTSYTGLTPVRWFDTRTGAGGVPIGPVRTGKPLSLKVAGVDGVPADATAVALNVTAVGASTPGYTHGVARRAGPAHHLQPEHEQLWGRGELRHRTPSAPTARSTSPPPAPPSTCSPTSPATPPEATTTSDALVKGQALPWHCSVGSQISVSGIPWSDRRDPYDLRTTRAIDTWIDISGSSLIVACWRQCSKRGGCWRIWGKTPSPTVLTRTFATPVPGAGAPSRTRWSWPIPT